MISELTKASPSTTQPETGLSILDAEALPNPTKNNFSILINSDNTKDPVDINVCDSYGRVIETKKVMAGSMLKIGDRYRSGIYYLHIMQGKKQKSIRLLKIAGDTGYFFRYLSVEVL